VRRFALAAVVLTFASPAHAAPVAVPAHVYAPYFETWKKGSLTATAQQSGARYFTLAFLESLSKTSCALAWNGRKADRVTNNRYAADLGSLRALGGDVFPSLGGGSADRRGTEIADSCKSVKAIAAAYEDVITRYDVTRLDMDVEGASLHRTRGIDRRNKALGLVETWAAAQQRPFQVSYTLPTSRFGLAPSGLAVLRNAVANGTRVDVVNIMAFDYYDRATTDMGTAATNAAEGTAAQLDAIGLPARIGITLMPGLDDYPKKTEKTTLAHAQHVFDYAQANDVDTLSIWAIQRDKGGGFTQVLQPFMG
jgi:hypothetical protein